MKRIKWNFLVHEIEKEDGELDRLIIPKDFVYSDDVLACAKREAYNGEYEIYDDGQPEPLEQTTPEQRIAELEKALALLLAEGR